MLLFVAGCCLCDDCSLLLFVVRCVLIVCSLLLVVCCLLFVCLFVCLLVCLLFVACCLRVVC